MSWLVNGAYGVSTNRRGWSSSAGFSFCSRGEAEAYVSFLVDSSEEIDYGCVNYYELEIPNAVYRDGKLYRIYRSFTSAWLAYAKGQLADYDLPKRVFLFNCGRVHVFPKVDDGTLPIEVSWAPGEEPDHGLGRVDSKTISGETLMKFEDFVAALRVADSEGRLYFRDEDLPEAVAAQGAA